MNIISISSSDKLSWGWLGCSLLWPGHHDIAKLSQLAWAMLATRHLAHCLLCNPAGIYYSHHLNTSGISRDINSQSVSTATLLLRLQQLTDRFKAWSMENFYLCKYIFIIIININKNKLMAMAMKNATSLTHIIWLVFISIIHIISMISMKMCRPPYSLSLPS